MRSGIHLKAIDTHTAGMPTRIVTGGLNVTHRSNGSVEDQRDEFEETQDERRKLLMKEPRGHRDMFGAVPTTPLDEDADIGLFFMDHDGYLDMCGHGTMGVVTAMVETDQLDAKSRIDIETPAGIVEAFPEVADGRVERVGVKNVESYVVDSTSVSVDVEDEFLEVDTTIVYAGNVFAMVDARELGLEVDTTNTNQFIEYGVSIKRTLNREHDISDPISEEPITVDITEFYDSSNDVDRNVAIFGDGSVDRSPCGTGTCAKMTMLYEKDELDLQEPYPHESIIGTRFEGELRDVETRNGVNVTTPIVSGSAHIIGDHTFTLDPVDPAPHFNVVDQ